MAAHENWVTGVFREKGLTQEMRDRTLPLCILYFTYIYLIITNLLIIFIIIISRNNFLINIPFDLYYYYYFSLKKILQKWLRVTKISPTSRNFSFKKPNKVLEWAHYMAACENWSRGDISRERVTHGRREIDIGQGGAPSYFIFYRFLSNYNNTIFRLFLLL